MPSWSLESSSYSSACVAADSSEERVYRKQTHSSLSLAVCASQVSVAAGKRFRRIVISVLKKFQIICCVYIRLLINSPAIVYRRSNRAFRAIS